MATITETGLLVVANNTLDEIGERIVGSTTLTETGQRVIQSAVLGQISPPGIPSAAAFGTPRLVLYINQANLTPGSMGIPSGQAFGTTSVVLGPVVTCFGIPPGATGGIGNQFGRVSINPQVINLDDGQNVWVKEFGWSGGTIFANNIVSQNTPGLVRFGVDEFGNPWYYFVVTAGSGGGNAALVRASVAHAPAIVDSTANQNGQLTMLAVAVPDGVMWGFHTFDGVNHISTLRFWNGTTASTKWTLTNSFGFFNTFFYSFTSGHILATYQPSNGNMRFSSWKYVGGQIDDNKQDFGIGGASVGLEAHWSEIDGVVWGSFDWALARIVNGVIVATPSINTPSGGHGAVVKVKVGGYFTNSFYLFIGVDEATQAGHWAYYVPSQGVFLEWSIRAPGELSSVGYKTFGVLNIGWSFVTSGATFKFTGVSSQPQTTGDLPSAGSYYVDWTNAFGVNGTLWATQGDANNGYITTLPQRYGIKSAQAFGTPKLNMTIGRFVPSGANPGSSPGRIASAEAFGLAKLSLGGIFTFPHNVNPIGIPSAMAFGTPKLNMYINQANLTPGSMGIPSSQAFGVTDVTVTLDRSGAIPTGEGEGTPRIILYINQANLTPGSMGIPSGQVFGTPGLGFLPAEFIATGGLLRHMLILDFGGPNQTILECMPFEWPMDPWHTLDVNFTMETGWTRFDAGAYQRLINIYNGAKGSVEYGMKGLLAQYLPGTGQSKPILCMDWRNNSGYFVFHPNDGFARDKIQEIQSEAHYTGRLSLVKVG